MLLYRRLQVVACTLFSLLWGQKEFVVGFRVHRKGTPKKQDQESDTTGPDAPRDFDYCAALTALAGSHPPYLAVISRKDPGEYLAWALKLPIPHLVYSYVGSASGRDARTYSVAATRGGPSSAYVQFIVHHYGCLPKWVLFLHTSTARGRGFHPLDPSSSSALVDVKRVDKGYLALGHLSAAAASSPSSPQQHRLHPAAEGFSANAPPRSHRPSFVAQEEGKVGCECFLMRRLFLLHGGGGPNEGSGSAGGTSYALGISQRRPVGVALEGAAGSLNHAAVAPVQCDWPYSWQPGSTFWASDKRMRQRSLPFWQSTLAFLLEEDDFALEDSSSQTANLAAMCVESLWHFLLGQPLFHFQPAFEAFEELPLVTFAQRCRDANAPTSEPACAAALRADAAGEKGGNKARSAVEGDQLSAATSSSSSSAAAAAAAAAEASAAEAVLEVSADGAFDLDHVPTTAGRSSAEGSSSPPPPSNERANASATGGLGEEASQLSVGDGEESSDGGGGGGGGCGRPETVPFVPATAGVSSEEKKMESPSEENEREDILAETLNLVVGEVLVPSDAKDAEEEGGSQGEGRKGAGGDDEATEA